MTSERDEPHTAPAQGRIEEAARRRLGHNLRLLYASVLAQPLPERFTRLLDELAAQNTTTGDDTQNRERSR